jgi:hypothetical protein
MTATHRQGSASVNIEVTLIGLLLGYGLDRLKEINWLHEVSLYYWGDIDTHGFAILNRLRSSFPDSVSFLMDRATLLTHRNLWGHEPLANRFEDKLPNLAETEQSLFQGIMYNRLADGVRLEQERISFEWLRKTLGRINEG